MEMSTIDITLFGTLSIEHKGCAITRFQGTRTKDLLSYLLLNRDANHSREYLAGLFSGHLEDQKARHCLNTALWRLQSVLGAADAHSATAGLYAVTAVKTILRTRTTSSTARCHHRAVVPSKRAPADGRDIPRSRLRHTTTCMKYATSGQRVREGTGG